jgi:hypothetical protein
MMEPVCYYMHVIMFLLVEATSPSFSTLASIFATELLGVLRIEPMPTELYRLASNDAANGSSAEKVI